MGSFLPDHPPDNMIIIRTALLACTAALAAADTDPLYGYAGHHLGNGAGHLGYSSLGYGHGYGLGYGRDGDGKREAEPKAGADALYGSYGGYGLGHRAYSVGHGYGHLGHSSLGYGHGYGLGYGRYGYGLGHRTYSLGYGHGYGRGFGYGHGYG